MAKLGLDPTKDVTFAQIPQTSLLAALKNGSVEAASIPQPQAAMAQRDGLKELIFTGDIMPLGVDGLGTTDKKIKDNLGQVQRMLKATVKTLRYMKEHRDEVVRSPVKDFEIDQQLAQVVWDDQVTTLSSTGLLSDEGIKSMIEAAVFSGETKGDVNPEKGADFSILKGVLKGMGISQ